MITEVIWAPAPASNGQPVTDDYEQLVARIAEPGFLRDTQHIPDQYHICYCPDSLCDRPPADMI